MGYNSLSGELSNLTFCNSTFPYTTLYYVFCCDKFELRVFFSLTAFDLLLCSHDLPTCFVFSQYVAGILMALSLSDKGYNALRVQAPSFKELGDIARLTTPLLLTMISKASKYST